MAAAPRQLWTSEVRAAAAVQHQRVRLLASLAHTAAQGADIALPNACIPTHPAHAHALLPPPTHAHPYSAHPLDAPGPGALHLPDSPPPFESREGEDDQLTPVFAHPHSAHPDAHHAAARTGIIRCRCFKFTTLEHHHDSWRPYGGDKRGP
ncbi:hypothetical protein MSAN_02116600 [Mycena sanguinolenta]|uniref:Uncharacterized protein n=1 Tax=Mycena sanguinolenta TaxID=230812 RepID=A0A8H7CLX0_9AGAR|nr:hypothetical protein MSAN_02116600 [Mycena sanguinolenta]